MTIKVKQNLVSSSKYSIKCPYSMDAEFITFHNTANNASAENEISYMLSNNNQVSYHYAVDDKEVIQGVPVNRNAWHCGDGNGNGNRKSIGVEVCYSKSGGEKYKKAEENAIQLIAQLLYERNWGIDRVKRHQEWSGKYCPHRVLAEGRWDEVLDRISAELKALKGETKEAIKVVEPVKEEVKSVITKTPSKATDESYVGKRVESIYKGSEGLNFYSKASWDKKHKVGTVAYGVGFPTIVDKVKVDGSDMYKVKNSKGTVYYITASSDYVKVEGETAKKTTSAKTETKKVAAKKKYIQLPKTSDSWRVYPTGKSPVKGNEKGFLNPKKFGGLEYEVLATPQTDLYTIKTGDFGKVNIYAASSTGAKVVTK